MDPITLLLLAWVLGRGKSPGPSAPQAETPPPAKANDRKATVEIGPAKITPSASPSALLRRATQARAKDWIPDLVAAGADADTAAALSRWIGIESAGNPLAVSRLGERGLLQIMRTTAQDGAITPAEWDALASPNTSRAEHARIALKQLAWHAKRARLKVTNPPPGNDAESWMWYAKFHHSRPVSLAESKPHGPARAFARDLGTRWASRPNEARRIAISNIVAFGKVSP